MRVLASSSSPLATSRVAALYYIRCQLLQQVAICPFTYFDGFRRRVVRVSLAALSAVQRHQKKI
jgi:hypothetical protein